MLLALALGAFGLRLLTGQAAVPRLPLDGPIVAFSVWTLLSAAFSADPLISHESAKKLVLFLLLYLAVECAAVEASRERLVDCALLGGLVLGAGALLQYFFLGFDTLDNRPRSFLGHYMTASGLSMGVLVLGAARLVFRRTPWRLPAREEWTRLSVLGAALAALGLLQWSGVLALEGERLFVAGLAAAGGLHAASSLRNRPDTSASTWLAALAVAVSTWALLLSRTRNAWLGTLAGLVVIAVLRAPRTLWLLAAGIGAVLVLRPAPVVERLTVTDASSVDRYYMWQAGLDMILDRPVFGQGPDMVEVVYPRFKWPQAPNPRQPHLHDNALQIAAERGLPCLAWWLWLVAAAMLGALREVRRSAALGAVPGPSAWGAAAALAVLTAVMAAGVFEYNFGDSEILMFTLLVLALPYGLQRERTLARG